MLILEKIYENVKKYPDTKAMISDGETITYKELWEKSGKLGNWILENYGENKTPVVVYGHKDILMLVCFIALVRTGRAYCPVDINMPLERINQIIEAVDNEFLFTTEDIDGVSDNFKKISKFEIEEIINGNGKSELKTSYMCEDNDTYYIIFTSGSTGKPKGVEISHGALSRFTDWSEKIADLNKENKIFLNQAPFSFDLSVMDVYTALACGGTFYCLTKKIQKDMASLLEAIKDGNINFWVSTPSFADMCLADKSFNEELMPKGEAFLFCGEKLTKETASKLMERFPKMKVVNTYGPTESTVAITEVVITKEMLEDEKELPIGRVKPGTEVKLSPEKELLIYGDTLSKGYFRNEEKTKEAFFIDENKERGYHTGDEGFFVDDMLYYRGRIDLQIKLHGYRIELGDIEANIMEQDGILQTAVLPKYENGKVRYLVAFVVTEDGEGNFARSKEIKTKLKDRLPEYMVPKKIVYRESLPMTPNGKTDRKKLEELL